MGYSGFARARFALPTLEAFVKRWSFSNEGITEMPVSKALPVKISGYGILIVGILNTIIDFVSRIEYSFPLNMGLAIGNVAIVFLGAITVMIAQCLKSLEQRLAKIESQSASRKNG